MLYNKSCHILGILQSETEVDMYCLDVGVVLQHILAQVFPNTRLFVPTKGHLSLSVVGAVDPSSHHAC